MDPILKQKIQEEFYGLVNGTKRYINQGKENISNIAQEAKKQVVQARNTSKNFVSDVNEGCIKGDYTQNTNAGTLAGQVICGEIPILGTAADARDLKASIDNCNGLTWGCAGNVSLGAVGFIPVLGSVKNLKHADKAGGFARGAGKAGDDLVSIWKNVGNVEGYTPSAHFIDNLSSTIKGFRKFSVHDIENTIKHGLYNPIGKNPGTSEYVIQRGKSGGTNLKVVVNENTKIIVTAFLES